MWIAPLLGLCGLAGWATVHVWNGKPAGWKPYGGRGKVSQVLLQLTGEGPKGAQAIHVPEGFEVELAAGPDLVQYAMFASLDDRGRLFVCESAGRNGTDQELSANPQFRIRLLEDTNGDGVYDRSKVFADKLTMSMGALWYRGSLYVAAPPDVLKLDDTDGDGVADRRTVILTGWPLKSNATTLHGPFLGPDGWMHLTYSPSPYRIQTKEGTVIEGRGGRVWRFRPDGTGLEWFVGGVFDNPVEVVFTPAGETFGTLTYSSPPRNGERDGILHYVDGGVYPKWTERIEELPFQRTGDLMPVMTRFARVAPAGLAYYKGTGLGAGYRGNLFSAHFNPHRILRHQVFREGATYRTEDQEFLTSDDIDFHPTDVLEDGDGSLLVVDTGGWYLHGCPVSRVSKPEYKGALYRVRKKGAPRVNDPFGAMLGMEKLPATELTGLLADTRTHVRERALDLLTQRGSEAIGALKNVRESSPSSDVRAAAVFALGRIRDPIAWANMRAGLSDPNLDVRVAAARMAGLNKDTDATFKLMEMVEKDEPAARRQAAEALGRIGDLRSIGALLEASAKPGDRFIEHSIIYALIRLKTSQPLVEGLRDPRPPVRKASLIALDQMEGKPLRREQLLGLLRSTDEDLAKAVLWVAARHREWSGDVLGFVRERFKRDADLHVVRRALSTFCPESGMHTMVADLLRDRATSTERRLFLMDAIEHCSLDKMPAPWIEQLGKAIAGGAMPVRERAVQMAGARDLAELDPQLERMAHDSSEPAALRTAAMGALAVRHPELTQADLQFLLGVIGEKEEANLRLSAAQVLGRSRLSAEQLMTLAAKHIASADPLVLPVLLEAYRHTKDEAVGKALIQSLLASKHPVGGMAADRLEEMLKGFPAGVRTAAQPLVAQFAKERSSQLERLKELEPLLNAGGDLGRGRKVFFGDKAGCSSCHTIGSEGANVGPDLTAVGAVRTGLDILEAILFPSASFVPGHEVYRVTTARDVYTGVSRSSSGEGVVTLVSGPKEVLRIPRKEVVKMELSPVSLMPDGFDKSLERQELVDLLAFLQAQRSRVESGRMLVSELE